MSEEKNRAQEGDNPYARISAKRKLLTLVGIYCAALVTRFISTGSFTVWPMAAQDIGGMEIYPLASSVTGIISICAMPVYGYLGSRYPALKRVLLIGSLFLGAIVLLGIALAPNMLVIIAINSLYGLVSASIFVVAFSLIRDMYSAKQAGVYLGIIGTMTSIGMLVGPALMGLIIDNFGWRVTFHVEWPLLLFSSVVIFLGLRSVQVQAQGRSEAKAQGASSVVQSEAGASVAGRTEAVSAAGRPAGFDLIGALSLTMFLAGLILSLSFGYSYVPFGTPVNTALLILAAAGLLVLILTVRRKGARAFIPAPVLKDRNTVVLALCNFFCNFSTIALTFFMPSYIINVLQGTALQAGLATAIYAVLGVFICPLLGRLIARRGTARGVFTVGTIVRIGVTLAFILFLNPDTTLWAVYALMLVAGFYSAQQNVTFSSAPQIQIKQELRFQANSVVQTAQNLGSSIGMAVYTAVMALFGIAGGMNNALILAAAAAVIALVAGQFLLPASALATPQTTPTEERK